MAKAKTKAAPEPPAAPQTIACAICSANINAAEYGAHVAQFHAPAPAAPAPARAAIPQYTPPPGAPSYQPPPQQGGQQPLQPITGAIPGKDLVGGNYLKGTDVPDGQSEVRVRILGFVIDPRGRSKLAAQIEPMYGTKNLWGLNTTNIRALVSLGFSDLQQVAGKTVVCMVGLAPNPQQNGAMVRSLFVQRVE